jgi:hypothetical protein
MTCELRTPSTYEASVPGATFFEFPGVLSYPARQQSRRRLSIA